MRIAAELKKQATATIAKAIADKIAGSVLR